MHKTKNVFFYHVDRTQSIMKVYSALTLMLVGIATIAQGKWTPHLLEIEYFLQLLCS